MNIDSKGFRWNVGIVLCNQRNKIFFAKRIGQHSWQFPQGGIVLGEALEAAMYRELQEELGLTAQQVELVTISKQWLTYRIPERFIRQTARRCIGQKQKWFLLRLSAGDEAIQLAASSHPEFDAWEWVSFWYPLRQVVAFKKNVYRQVLKEFLPFLHGPQSS